jgi:hypothetical protein
LPFESLALDADDEESLAAVPDVSTAEVALVFADEVSSTSELVSAVAVVVVVVPELVERESLSRVELDVDVELVAAVVVELAGEAVVVAPLEVLSPDVWVESVSVLSTVEEAQALSPQSVQMSEKVEVAVNCGAGDQTAGGALSVLSFISIALTNQRPSTAQKSSGASCLQS